MSFEMTKRVRDFIRAGGGPELDGIHLAVLMFLADAYNPPRRMYHSQATVAKQTRFSPKTVWSKLRELVQWGFLTQQDRPGSSCVYDLVEEKLDPTTVPLTDPTTVALTTVSLTTVRATYPPPYELRDTPVRVTDKPISEPMVVGGGYAPKTVLSVPSVQSGVQSTIPGTGTEAAKAARTLAATLLEALDNPVEFTSDDSRSKWEQKYLDLAPQLPVSQLVALLRWAMTQPFWATNIAQASSPMAMFLKSIGTLQEQHETAAASKQRGQKAAAKTKESNPHDTIKAKPAYTRKQSVTENNAAAAEQAREWFRNNSSS